MTAIKKTATEKTATGKDTAGENAQTAEKARRLRDLHVPGTPLVLANAWDVASARVVEEAGAAAVATTSAGVAWALGFPDGDRLPRERAVDLVARVVEGGFGIAAVALVVILARLPAADQRATAT